MAAPKNPKGAKSDKLWRDAIMRAVHREMETSDGKPTRKLEALADALVASGLDGNPAALKEIGDRLDGRAHQTAEITVSDKRAEDLTDSDLAGIIGSRRSPRTSTQAVDPAKLN